MGACCEKGPARMAEIGHSQLERIIAGLADITVVEFAFGDIYARSGPKSRQIATSRR